MAGAEGLAATANLVGLDVVLAGMERLALAVDGEVPPPAAGVVRCALVLDVRDAPAPDQAPRLTPLESSVYPANGRHRWR